MHNLFCNKKISLLLASFSLLTIIGLGIILYDDDLTDTNCPPDIAAKYPVIFFHNQEALKLKVQPESANYFFLHKNPSLNKSPPTA